MFGRNEHKAQLVLYQVEKSDLTDSLQYQRLCVFFNCPLYKLLGLVSGAFSFGAKCAACALSGRQGTAAASVAVHTRFILQTSH